MVFEDQGDAADKALMREMNMKSLTHEAVAKDGGNNQNEWYHALITIEDLPILLALPDLKVYVWYRFKHVADGGSEPHFHWHGLVHFPNGELESWKR